MQLPGTEGVKRAVEAGLGVGMVSRYAVESEVQTGVLRRIPIEGWQLRRSMNLVHRAQKYFSPVGLRFREFALSYGAEHLDRLDTVDDRRPRAGGAARRATPRKAPVATTVRAPGREPTGPRGGRR
jgi:hypothetical protein